MILKKSWLLLLMVFIISWASFANAYIIQQHQQRNFDTTLQSSEHGFQDQVNLNCHDEVNSVTQVQHQDNKIFSKNFTHSDVISHSSMDCQDCHIFHCQLASSGLLPELMDLVLSYKMDYMDDNLTAYDNRNLTGYTDQILRPPKS